MTKAAEARMQAALLEARASFEHSGNKGSAVEESVRVVLRKYLPRVAAVGHGEVVDSQGNRSRQTDIVVVSEDHPRIYEENQPSLFFVEGVTAAGEVKSVLTSEELRRSVEAASIFKRLRADPGKGAMTHSNPSDLARFGKCPPYFLFSLESEISRDKIAQVMNELFAEDPTRMDGSLDAILVLGRGLWIHLGDGQGAFAVLKPDGELASGWFFPRSEYLLYDFIAWLTIVMPRIIRAAPILASYLLESGGLDEIRSRSHKADDGANADHRTSGLK
ncbi:MAG: DUF6602 domain-containing protein [Candidatus Limnocylindrales bacterium]